MTVGVHIAEALPLGLVAGEPGCQGSIRDSTVSQCRVSQSWPPVTEIVSAFGSRWCRWSMRFGGTISSSVGDQIVTGWVTLLTSKVHGAATAW